VGDALVVEGVDGQLVAEDGLGSGAGHHPYQVLAELRPAHRAVVVVTEHVGQVLVQVAAVCDGHQLHTPADTEDGQAVRDGGAQGHRPGGVAHGLDRGGGVRLGTVQRGVDVGAPGKHDPIEAFEYIWVRRIWRDQSRTTAALVYRMDVRERKNRGKGVLKPEP